MVDQNCMLTTIDNPYDPFTQFKHWFLFDVEKGYNSCGYLARLCFVSDEMTEEEVSNEIESAIDDIVRLDFTKMYKKVYRNNKKTA